MSAPSAPGIDGWPTCLQTSIRFWWQAPASGAPLTKYTLACAAISYSQDLSGDVLSYTVTGLTAGTEYEFTLAATNTTGIGPALTFPKVGTGLVPFGPTAATVSTVNASTALVSWTPSTIANQAPIRGYFVTAIPSTAGASTLFKTEYGYRTSTFIKGISTNTYYRFLVQGVAAPGYCIPFAYTSSLGFGITTLPFSPSSLSGVQIWYDGADPLGTGLAPSSGTSISSWYDKSGRSNNATAAVAATYSTSVNGNFLNFNGSSTYYNIGSGSFIVNQYNTIFIVEKLQKSVADFMTVISGSGNTDRTNLLIRYNNTTDHQISYYGLPGYLNATGLSYGGASQPSRIWSYSQNASDQRILLNGSTVVTSANNTLLTSWAGPTIGRDSDTGGRFYGGEIREILFYTGTMPAYDRQKVEGYLGWKWGLQSNLPATHPFKTAAPTAASVFSPSNFSSLQLWLDGTDPSATGTAPANGTSITTWADKSGTGNNATTSGTAAIYDSARSSIYFGASTSNYSMTYSASLANETAFIVARLSTTSTGTPGFVGSATGGRSLSFKCDTNQLALSSRAVGYGSITASGTLTRNVTTLATYVNTANSGIVTLDGGRASGTSVSLTFSNALTTDIAGNFTNMCEILAYNRPLSTDDRQTVEGYLAWKWGLQGNLPLTHPYLLKNPGSVDTIPVNTSNLLIRFDATTYSGSGTWSNTGSLGAAYNAAVENGTPSKNGAGNGIVLNGSTNFNFSSLTTAANFTLSVWFKRTANQTNLNASIVTDNYNGGPINMAIVSQGATQFSGQFYNGSAWTNGTNQTFNLNQWTSMACSWDGSNFVTYINGTSVNTSNYTGRSATSSGLPYRIGRGWDNWLYVIGEIGQVLIYNRPLTAAEVAQNYAATSNTFTV